MMETIAMANPRADTERRNEAPVLSSISIRIFVFLLLTATSKPDDHAERAVQRQFFDSFRVTPRPGAITP